jgi:hypothetical protein
MLRINQSAQVDERVNANAWFVLDHEPITDLGIQHPLGYCDLWSPGRLNDQNRRIDSPQMSNYFDFDLIEGMKTIADFL